MVGVISGSGFILGAVLVFSPRIMEVSSVT